MLMANMMMPSMLPLNTISPQFPNLSSSNRISQFNLQTLISIHPKNTKFNTIIRNGGGPRTYPGGVSKWQWKRMQLKKQKQLLKARLCRERQIYEMRKRAELKAAVSELERPWEVVERASAAPTLFSVSADEQVKTLADRFQKPGGFDLWSERDGPMLFSTHDGLPSARFLPKGAVHSVKPYGVRGSEEEEVQSEGLMYNGRKKRLRRKNLDGDGEGEGNLRSGRELVGGLKNLRISSGTREERLGEGYGKNGSSGGFRSDESKQNGKLENSYGGRGRLRSNESSRNVIGGSSNRVQWNSKQLPRDDELENSYGGRGRMRSNELSRNGVTGSSNRAHWDSKQLPRDDELENSYGGRGRLRSNELSRNVITGSSNRAHWDSKQLPRDDELDNSYGGRGRLRSNESSRNIIAGISNQVRWGSKQLPRGNENSLRMSTGQDRERFGNNIQREGPGGGRGRGRGRGKASVAQSREAYDMSLKHDGSYEFQSNLQKDMFLGDVFDDDDFELDLTNWRTSKG